MDDYARALWMEAQRLLRNRKKSCICWALNNVLSQEGAIYTGPRELQSYFPRQIRELRPTRIKSALYWWGSPSNHAAPRYRQARIKAIDRILSRESFAPDFINKERSKK